jgi:hypothetical protein
MNNEQCINMPMQKNEQLKRLQVLLETSIDYRLWTVDFFK